jgi:hypothetical protein
MKYLPDRFLFCFNEIMYVNSLELSLDSCTTINCSLLVFFFGGVEEIVSIMWRRNKYHWIQRQGFQDSPKSGHLASVESNCELVSVLSFVSNVSDLISVTYNTPHCFLQNSVSSSPCGSSPLLSNLRFSAMFLSSVLQTKLRTFRQVLYQ